MYVLLSTEGCKESQAVVCLCMGEGSTGVVGKPTPGPHLPEEVGTFRGVRQYIGLREGARLFPPVRRPHAEQRVVLRGVIVKNDSGAYAVFTEQGSSASFSFFAPWMCAVC